MILDKIVAEKRRLHAARAPIGLDMLWHDVRALPPVRSFAAALRDQARAAPRPVPRVIAEFKRRSPSAGAIRPGADPAEIARSYQRAGAAALSVLTDEHFFGGRMEDLAVARTATALPVLRKDFLLDERDLLEARLGGADAALLIVRIVDRARLEVLLRAAREAGLAALLEAHSAAEIDVALAAGADLIGINHRDLDTLAIDLELSARARAQVGPSVTLVAESGIQTRADVERMRQHGADAILVGESLLRAPDAGAALQELIACS